MVYLQIVRQCGRELAAAVGGCGQRCHHGEGNDRRGGARQLQSGSEPEHTRELHRTERRAGQGDEQWECPDYRFDAGGVLRWRRLDELLGADGTAVLEVDVKLYL